MQRFTRFLFAFLFAVGLLQLSACRENPEEGKAVSARVEEKIQDNQNAARDAPEPVLKPEAEPEVTPTVVPPGNKAPRPVNWYVSVEAAAISPSGKYVVLGYKGGKPFNVGFRIWDMEKGKLYAALKGHEDAELFLPAFCSFLGDDRRVISVSLQGKAIIHKLTVKGNRSLTETVETFWVHELGMVQCALSENARYLITLGMDPGYDHLVTKIWDVENAKLVRILDDQIASDWLAGVSISPNGSFALTQGIRAPDPTGKQSDIYLWDVKGNKVLKKFLGADKWLRPMVFSGDGKEFVLGKMIADNAADREFTLWDLKSLTMTQTIKDATKKGCANDLRRLPGSSIWIGNAGIPHEEDSPPAVGFWDFGAGKHPKIIRLDNGRFDKPSVLKPTWRIPATATSISATGKYALVASGGNRCTAEFRRSDDTDLSGGFLYSRHHAISIEIHIWDLTTSELHRTWPDPTPSLDADASSTK
jgi:WD40 repeat protein